MYRTLLFLWVFRHCFCENCVCVPFWKCDDDSLGSYEDYSAMGLSILAIVSRSGCDGYFDVCCAVKCGRRKPEDSVLDDMIRDRIAGATSEASFAEFPWMLGILENGRYLCGASLIHPRVALTAAHCVRPSTSYKIRAGEWNWRSRTEPLKHQDRIAEKVIIHPRYNPESLINDIALVTVERPFQLSDNVGVICLPEQNSSPFPEECLVTGWGRTSHRTTKHQAILNKASFPIVPNYACQESLQRALLGPKFELHNSFMCAGGKHIDTCKGDGGSPLTCRIEGEQDRYEQFGIVSWGLLCGVHDTPGVYVNVARFMLWIDENMMELGFKTEVYKYRK